MFEGKPLSQISWEDLVGFLELGRVEGEDLDYKQAWKEEIVGDVCAMANTVGGDILVGVKEKSSEGGVKTDRPNPDDVPGIEKTNKLSREAVAAKVRSRTRPTVVPEVTRVDVPGDEGKAVLVIRVPESPDAPHEVRLSSSPYIPVRRGANTESAGVDDVERMLRRGLAQKVRRWCSSLGKDFSKPRHVEERS